MSSAIRSFLLVTFFLSQVLDAAPRLKKWEELNSVDQYFGQLAATEILEDRGGNWQYSAIGSIHLPSRLKPNQIAESYIYFMNPFVGEERIPRDDETVFEQIQVFPEAAFPLNSEAGKLFILGTLEQLNASLIQMKDSQRTVIEKELKKIEEESAGKVKAEVFLREFDAILKAWQTQINADVKKYFRLPYEPSKPELRELFERLGPSYIIPGPRAPYNNQNSTAADIYDLFKYFGPKYEELAKVFANGMPESPRIAYFVGPVFSQVFFWKFGYLDYMPERHFGIKPDYTRVWSFLDFDRKDPAVSLMSEETQEKAAIWAKAKIDNIPSNIVIDNTTIFELRKFYESSGAAKFESGFKDDPRTSRANTYSKVALAYLAWYLTEGMQARYRQIGERIEFVTEKVRSWSALYTKEEFADIRKTNLQAIGESIARANSGKAKKFNVDTRFEELLAAKGFTKTKLEAIRALYKSNREDVYGILGVKE